jgi:lipopolysaccharide export system protein LptA
MYRKALSIGVLIFCCWFRCVAQEPSKIHLVHSDALEYDEKKGGKVRKLIGNVQFEQDTTVMFCDSAYFPMDRNYIECFAHVHIIKNDSIHIYGEELHYNGDTKFAEMFRKVRLTNHDMTMTTEYLTYDMVKDIANYTNNAKIVDKENTLTSKIGFYYSDIDVFVFHKKVVLVNPKYTIHTDTMNYNTVTKMAYFLGPTTIISKENLIYCENGWYDTERDVSSFKEHSYIITKEQKMWGDSMYYDRGKGFGQAFRNVVILDTVQKILVNGDYGEYHDVNEISLVTGHAMMTQIFEKDSLFMHGDTLKSTFDSIKNVRTMYCFHHVRFFKSDLQGRCDSLVYSSYDSITRMFYSPIVWSEKNQMTGDTITITMKNKKIDQMNIYHNSFIISQNDSLRYDQVKGKNSIGYFDDSSHLSKVKVMGNGQTIYYGKDKDNKYVGVNRADCTDIWIFMQRNKVHDIKFIKSPDATFYPINELSPQELRLKDFKWLNDIRPMEKADIFKE